MTSISAANAECGNHNSQPSLAACQQRGLARINAAIVRAAHGRRSLLPKKSQSRVQNLTREEQRPSAADRFVELLTDLARAGATTDELFQIADAVDALVISFAPAMRRDVRPALVREDDTEGASNRHQSRVLADPANRVEREQLIVTWLEQRRAIEDGLATLIADDVECAETHTVARRRLGLS